MRVLLGITGLVGAFMCFTGILAILNPATVMQEIAGILSLGLGMLIAITSLGFAAVLKAMEPVEAVPAKEPSRPSW